jgi:hypothetical protein
MKVSIYIKSMGKKKPSTEWWNFFLLAFNIKINRIKIVFEISNYTIIFII